jgi:hypothetical protein
MMEHPTSESENRLRYINNEPFILLKQAGITYEKHDTFPFGEIITISRNGNPIGRIRQIGKEHPDSRLEWLTWKGTKSTEHGIQFPCVHLADITPQDILNVTNKYLGEQK